MIDIGIFDVSYFKTELGRTDAICYLDKRDGRVSIVEIIYTVKQFRNKKGVQVWGDSVDITVFNALPIKNLLHAVAIISLINANNVFSNNYDPNNCFIEFYEKYDLYNRTRNSTKIYDTRIKLTNTFLKYIQSSNSCKPNNSIVTNKFRVRYKKFIGTNSNTD